ncbi:MAG TPA: hypothetical protein PKL39_04825 [Bacillota bacterium]|nr:hypothetical protein [Bacillota bacterium]HPZ91465.1 hypothetical protein [Bacillota bacterium]HQE01282.1 hypothetical protein [Bacillota bacterium]
MTAWMAKPRVLAVGILTAGLLLAGCVSNSQGDLTLLAEPTNTFGVDEEIRIALANPSQSMLFVPASWAGLAVYRQLPSQGWGEHILPDIFQPMQATTASRIEYSIPSGILEPGNYKLVLQGRKGEEGTPFSVEVNLMVVQSQS